MRSVKFVLTLMVLGFWCPAWLHAEGALPVIKGVRVFRAGESVGVEISADKHFEYTCTKMPQLLKVVVDLPRTEPGGPDIVYRYKSALVSNIWLEKKTINDVVLTRVSVNLAEDADFTVSADTPDSKKVTVIFRKPPPVASAVTARPAAKPGSVGRERQPAAGKPSAPEAPVAKGALRPFAPLNDHPISVTGVYWGSDSIEIKSGGSIAEFKAFTLQQPGRLVIDIPGGQTTLGTLALPANRFGISKVRLALFGGKLRVVFDAGAKPFPGYDVVQTGAGLRVVLRAPDEAKK